MKEHDDEQYLHLENEEYYYRRIDPDSFFLRKELFGYEGMNSVDITASRTIIGTGRLKGGSLFFTSKEGETELKEGLFGMYIPPFSIYQCRGEFESLELALLISSTQKHSVFSSSPLLFPSGKIFTGSREETTDLFNSIGNVIPANRAGLHPSPAAKAAKKMIEAQYEDLSRVSGIARKLGMKNWELSRVFRHSYGITPLNYLNNLRTVEAVYRIIDSGRNKKIIDIAFNVGFRDLSRFNKQFRKFHRFIPKNLFPKK